MLFDDKTKGIAQAYLSMLEQNNNLNESHYKVGERVKCKKSGMLGKVTKVDPKGEGKYYTVKQDSGREMTFAPDELTSVSADVKEASCNTKKEAIEIVMPKKSKADDEDKDDEDEMEDDDEEEDDDEVKIKVKDEKSDKKAKMTEALKGNQHKLDRNNNGKLDAQDFKMLKGKKVKEDVEQVDELSGDTVASYHYKAGRDLAKRGGSSVAGPATDADKQKVSARRAGMSRALPRIMRSIKNEDVEQVDEVSKRTLGSYVKKAAMDAVIQRKIGADFENLGNKARKPSMKSSAQELEKQYTAKSRKRRAGINTAVDRLTKEDVEVYEAKDPRFTSFDTKLPHHLSTFSRRSDNERKTSTDLFIDKFRKQRLAKSNIYRPKANNTAEAVKNGMKEEIEQMEEGKMGQLSADLTDLSHSDFHKQYGKPKSHYDSSNFKKPVQKGKEMDRAKSLAQRGMASMKKEDYAWDWDAILEAPEEEIDALIEELNDADYKSFVTEFDTLDEAGENWYQGSTNSKQPMDANGRETLEPRAEADKAFVDAHRKLVKVTDYPGKDKPATNAKPQAGVRPGDNRNSEGMKTLSDIRRK
jgi:hypothetical protein